MRLRPSRREAEATGTPSPPAGRAWLALALGVIAVVPLAIGGVVALGLGDGDVGTSGDSPRAAAQLEVGRIGATLGRPRAAMTVLAADADLVRFVDSRGREARADAGAALLALSRSIGTTPNRASVFDAKGAELARVVDGRAVDLPRTKPTEDESAIIRAARVADDGGLVSAIPHPSSPEGVAVLLAVRIAGRTNGALLVEVPITPTVGRLVATPADGGPRDDFLPVPDAPGLFLEQAPSSAAGELQGPTAPLPITVSAGLCGVLALAGLLALAVIRRQVRPTHELAASQEALRKAYEAARSDSMQDPLTGLGNNRGFLEEMARQMDVAQRYGTSLSLLLIDLDDLKVVNDAAGHAAGDDMIAAMGSRITRSARKADRGFRIGGDEFAVLMPHTDAAGADVLARRLLRSVLEPTSGDRFGRPFSFSGGISAYPELAADQHQLSAQADGALYWSKRHGRTGVTTFDPSRHRSKRSSDGLAALSSVVVRLVEQRAISVVYQPIVDLQSGIVLGFEGLVRPASGSGFDNAGMLFSAAEESGRTVDLDRICLEAVVAGAAKLHPATYVSLNVSPRTVESPEFSSVAFLRLLAHHRIAPNRVIVELTEREEVENVARLRSNLATCQAAGVRVAADDVGSGNAGLRLLSQVHFDLVKVDLTLIQGGVSREASSDVITTLAELASRWGATVVAEGIETPEELRFVRKLGLTAGQGYLLGRPTENPTLERVDLQALMGDVDWLDRVVAASRASRAPVPVATRASRSAT